MQSIKNCSWDFSFHNFCPYWLLKPIVCFLLVAHTGQQHFKCLMAHVAYCTGQRLKLSPWIGMQRCMINDKCLLNEWTNEWMANDRWMNKGITNTNSWMNILVTWPKVTNLFLYPYDMLRTSVFPLCIHSALVTAITTKGTDFKFYKTELCHLATSEFGQIT